MAKGFCVCHRYTDDPAYLPAPGAAWHYLCDKPVLPPPAHEPDPAKRVPRESLASCGHPANEDGECDCSSWPERAVFAPEYEPGDGEAQRIAEVFADARAEQDRGL